MSSAQVAIGVAVEQVKRLRGILKKSKTRQVGSLEERQLVTSTALAWFKSHLDEVLKSVAPDDIADVNAYYRELLNCADGRALRTRYDKILKNLGAALAVLRRDLVSGMTQMPSGGTPDEAPDFAKIASDPRMRDILRRRWVECSKCVASKAPLAATVMMGGMLESLLVARANLEKDKAKLFASDHVPINHKTQKRLPFQEWTLKTYIDVASDMRWITRSARDVGEVIRDYRNYVHPYKEYIHNVALTDEDAEMFWEITKQMARQLLS